MGNCSNSGAQFACGCRTQFLPPTSRPGSQQCLPVAGYPVCPSCQTFLLFLRSQPWNSRTSYYDCLLRAGPTVDAQRPTWAETFGDMQLGVG